MGNSASTGGKVTSQDKAIFDLKVQRDKLKQYQKRLQFALDTESNAAKRALTTGQKSKALTALRQRKYQETLLAKTETQLMNLQELLATIEHSLVQSQVIASLQKGSVVLKQLQKGISLEKVQDVMDDAREGVEAQKEIDTVLMSEMSPDEEEAVQAEFAQLQEELGIKEAHKLEPPHLPSVPQTELPTKQDEDEVKEGRKDGEPHRQDEEMMVAA